MVSFFGKVSKCKISPLARIEYATPCELSCSSSNVHATHCAATKLVQFSTKWMFYTFKHHIFKFIVCVCGNVVFRITNPSVNILEKITIYSESSWSNDAEYIVFSVVISMLFPHLIQEWIFLISTLKINVLCNYI